MDATTAQPTLLSAARDFIRKSAGTAVLVIAPLAALTAANEAKSQVIFDVPPNFSGGGSIFSSGSGTSTAGAGTFFSSQLPQYGDIIGVKMGLGDAQFNFSSSGSATGNAGVAFPLSSFSGFISDGTIIPVAYNFTFTQTGLITLSSWHLYLVVAGNPELVANGTGAGTFTGASTDYVLSGDATDGTAYLELDFSYANAINGGVVHVLMNSSTQGISINAIPEPSTYAGLFGLGALGFVIVRRSRRAVAA